MQKFDVLIVGAGPAGSFAAERLAQKGVQVALFDGRPSHEAKACGGGVTSKALKAWPYLLEAVGREVNEVDMYAPSGKRLRLKLAEPFSIYSRRSFDSFLRERARKAGAHVFAERVSLSTHRSRNENWVLKNRSGGEWRAPVLVAADGAGSRIARNLAGALPTSEMEVAFGYRAPLAEGERPPTVIAFLPGWAGYAWAFPRVDHISYGIATAQDAFEHAALDELLWKFMIGYRRVCMDETARLWSQRKEDKARDEDVEKNLRATIERYAARIPGLAAKTWEKRKVCDNNWALLGDAAGFADPVTGEGIYYALRSAELFSDAYLMNDTSRYEQMWREDFGRELKRAAEMRGRFYGNFLGAPFTQRMIELGRAHKGIRGVLTELVAGDQGYVDLKSKLARRAVWPL